ncbi:DUF6586 family protein [Marinobacter salicampi]|uniref:DUF6586 family protein n=1 Tax=Marinobacter salicampi TaxID=435907 RepID=UPI001407A1BD|nr:DUF6586 family protein [Marinobacter salicampi]
MASEWYTLASQKLFLAETLLKYRPEGAGPLVEAHMQGAVELALRARNALLTLVARYYQHKNEQPESLSELIELIGPDSPDARLLNDLDGEKGSWLNHLTQLQRGQSHPPLKKKTVSDENIIAVGVESGPDRSPAALSATLSSMKHFLIELTERHEEW